MDYSQMSREQLEQRIKQLETDKAKETSKNIWFKVGDKGGVMVGGLQSFPVTLYYEQWQRLFARLEGPKGLKQFLEDHKSELKLKGAETQAA